MKVLSSAQEELLEALLRLAGGSGVLEQGLIRARAERGDHATVDDVIHHIQQIKREPAAPKVA